MQRSLEAFSICAELTTLFNKVIAHLKTISVWEISNLLMPNLHCMFIKDYRILFKLFYNTTSTDITMTSITVEDFLTWFLNCKKPRF